VIDEVARLLLADAGRAVEVGVRAVGQNLSQSGVEVEGVLRRRPIDGLRESVAQAVVDVRVRVRPLRHRLQPVGRVVAVCARAVAEQVAVVVPGVGLTIDASETIRIVVDIVGDEGGTACARAHGLRQAVACRIVAVLERAAIAVVGGGEAVERVVAVVDGGRGGGRRRGKGKVGQSAEGAAKTCRVLETRQVYDGRALRERVAIGEAIRHRAPAEVLVAVGVRVAVAVGVAVGVFVAAEVLVAVAEPG